MGRLFWKFFLFFFLAQIATVLGVGFAIGMREGPDPGPPGAPSGPPGPPPFAAEPPGRMPPPPPPRGPGPGRSGPILPFAPVAAGLVASLVFGALLAAYVSRPIRSLRFALDAATRGDLDLRATALMGRRRDELADLGRDFDRMAARLKAVLDSQRRLLHDVSHELRSPLARQQLAIDLARQQPEKIPACMDRLERELARMDVLVGELLALSRLEAGVSGEAEEVVDAREFLAVLVEDAAFEAQAKGVRIELRGGETIAIRGRPELLHRAVENVLRNAVQHAPAGTRVTVGARPGPTPDTVALAILDEGPGVPEDELPRLFEPFFRSRRSTPGKGHGLGLAIARRVVDMHGGSLRAANRPEGGLRMEVVLPAHPPGGAPTPGTG